MHQHMRLRVCEHTLPYTHLQTCTYICPSTLVLCFPSLSLSLSGRQGEADLCELHYSGFLVGPCFSLGTMNRRHQWEITGPEEGEVRVFTLLAPSLLLAVAALLYLRPQLLLLSPSHATALSSFPQPTPAPCPCSFNSGTGLGSPLLEPSGPSPCHPLLASRHPLLIAFVNSFFISMR